MPFLKLLANLGDTPENGETLVISRGVVALQKTGNYRRKIWDGLEDLVCLWDDGTTR